MANTLIERGREGFLDGSIDWDAGGTPVKAALLDLNTAETAVIQITSSTSATPPVMLVASNALSTGDLVYINGHTTNTACNGVWRITVSDATHFSLQNPVDGSNVVGTGGAGAAGYAVVLGGISTIGKFYSDWDGAANAVGLFAIGSPTVVDGVADGSDVTFTTVSGATVEAILIVADTTVASTTRVIGIITGQHIVTCNTTTTAVTIPVEPLVAGIPSGSVLKFSTGETATLTAPASAGARSITVTSTTVTAGARALAPATGSGLPVTPNGGNIVITWDNGVNKIFKL